MKSEGHPNTRGCKFEKDLASLSEQAQAIDVRTMALEKKWLCGTSLTDAEIKAAAEDTAEFVQLTKKGNKLKVALEQWMKIDPADGEDAQ